MKSKKIKKKVLLTVLSSIFIFTSMASLSSSFALEGAPVMNAIIDNSISINSNMGSEEGLHFANGQATVNISGYEVNKQGKGYFMLDIKKDFVKGASSKFFSKDDKPMEVYTSSNEKNKTIIEANFSSYQASESSYIRYYIPYESKNSDPISLTFKIPDTVQKKLDDSLAKASTEKDRKEASKATALNFFAFSSIVKDNEELNIETGQNLTYIGENPNSGFIDLQAYTNKEKDILYKGFMPNNGEKVFRIRPITRAKKIRLYMGANKNGFSYSSSKGNIELQYFDTAKTYEKVKKINQGKKISLRSDEYRKLTLPLSSSFASVDLENKTDSGIIEIKMPETNNMLLNIKIEAFSDVNPTLHQDEKKPEVVSKKYNVYRKMGENRYFTAIELSKSAFTKSDVVVLASGENFADALSGGGLASAYNAPILLTNNSRHTVESVNKEIDRLGAKKVFILGGRNSISIDTEEKITNFDNKSQRTVERIDGANRFETSYKVYREVARTQLGKESVILVNGFKFADALAAGPLSARTNKAILLTDGKNLLTGVENSDKNIVIGGLSSMDSSFKGRRIGGSDRYETSVNIAKELGRADNIILASGEEYPDALTSITLYNKFKAPLLLSQRYSLPLATKKYINVNSIKNIYIVGGTNSISTRIEDMFK